MEFNGPDSTDYDNVFALNHAWLSLLQRSQAFSRGLDVLPADLRQRLTNLSVTQINCLAKTPFLLLSFRESEEACWTRILGSRREPDLFALDTAGETDTLVSAALGFVWQLARRNPYALRVICGATLYWSERIAELTFLELLNAFRASGDAPAVRFGQQRDFWRMLLNPGVSRQVLPRHAAHMTALQEMLTKASATRREAWPLAARSIGTPDRRVAEANETTQD